MDFLKQIALPQSASHISVLHFVLNFIYIIFMPFVSYLFGALVLSLYYGRRGRKQNDVQALRFSKDVLDHVLPNKSILFLFGVIPYLALVFAYAQLLQGTSAISVGVLTWGAILFTAAAAFAASYHSALTISTVLEGVTLQSDETEGFRSQVVETKRTSGKYALLFSIASIFLLIAGTTLAANPANWETVSSVVGLVFSVDVLVRLLQFVVLSFAVTAVGTIYFTFSWEGGMKSISDEYAVYIKNKTLPLGLISIILLPLFVVLTVILTPVSGLSGTVFGSAILAILFLFLASHFVYGMIKNFQPTYAGNAFFLLIFVFLFVIVQETTTLSKTTQKHSALLAFQFDRYHDELLASMGISLSVISGEEIFMAKCSACHEFGQKKVGPAYKDILPKYENDRAKLVSFVLNPQKIDPAFPPMPNQGLKPAEADSIASYILKMYKQTK